MALDREAVLERELELLKGELQEVHSQTSQIVKACTDMGLEVHLDRENQMVRARSATPSQPRTQATASSDFSLEHEAASLEEVMAAASESEKSCGGYDIGPRTNKSVIFGSVLALPKLAQALIYLIALGGIMFVFFAKSGKLGDAEPRMLHGTSVVMTKISFCIACAGLVAFMANLLNQPLILGYLLGGVLVGPFWGLNIVPSHDEITEMSSLGLVLLLFMIGLDLNLSGLLRMGKVVIVTGLFQFPLCFGIMFSIFTGLEAAGISFGEGKYAAMYCGMTTGASSTIIIVKLLSEKSDMDSTTGRLTIGIMIFQDIWSIVCLAIQPDLANPQVKGVLKTFGMIALLIVIALAYAKFVMPAVFVASSKSVELMFILSLTWCFFVCCLASLPFIGLSMELASLIAGAALATFPYSNEFLGKLKYIRDFFIALFFVSLGMQIPSPNLEVIAKALIVAAVVVAVRWIGVYLIVYLVGGGKRLAGLATLNLSQISELALVTCSLGINFNHVEEDTLAILIWAFFILAVLGSYMIKFNYTIYGKLAQLGRTLMRKDPMHTSNAGEDQDVGHADRNIILLGFHNVAAMLVAHWEHHNPHLLAKVHVIDFNNSLKPELEKRGVTCAYGDISSPDVLERCHRVEVRLVICSTPDALLRSVSNLRLLEVSKQVWPKADVVVTADTPFQAHQLYENGADYVLRMAKLSAERLHDVILHHTQHYTHHRNCFHQGQVFDQYKNKDQTEKFDDQHISLHI